MVNRIQAITTVVETVPDPEIPALTLMDLGIVRNIQNDAVTITPTYTGCPASAAIELSLRQALDGAGFGDVALETIISPPWTSEWITTAGHEKLKAYGIAPPCSDGSINCPQCGSARIEKISEHGSTACKALYRCRDCLEPFDYFKCI